MTKRFKVFYRGAGYVADTIVEAQNKADAARIVKENYSNCVEVRAVIGPLNR